VFVLGKIVARQSNVGCSNLLFQQTIDSTPKTCQWVETNLSNMRIFPTDILFIAT
jgi:hypothetical protein